MSKSDQRRAAILDQLADHVLAEGLAGASLKRLAEAAGTSDRMLLYYFSDKSDILTAALNQIAARLLTALDAQKAAAQKPVEELRPGLVAMTLAPELRAFMNLWLEIAAAAARGDPLCRNVGEMIGRGFLDWVASQIEAPDDASRAAAAAELFATIEGAALLNAMGMEDVSRRIAAGGP